MEVLSHFGRGENPLRDLVPCGPCNQTTPNNVDSPGVGSSSPTPLSPMLSPVAALPQHPVNVVPIAADTQQGIHAQSLMYLMDCYARVTVEERNHPKVRTHKLHDRVPRLLEKSVSCYCALWLQSWKHLIVLF
jgi:ubiquitin conjugation factor E4 B